MSNGHLTEHTLVLAGLSPSADLYAGDPSTDEVNMKNYNRVAWVLHQVTAGTNTGTAVVTVEAMDAASGGSATALPFSYRKKTTGASEVWGDVTQATASGFTTTANEDTIYVIELEDQAVPAGSPYVRLTLTEAVDDPCIGSVVTHLTGGRYKEPAGAALT